jgi:ferric enterobactin receptor
MDTKTTISVMGILMLLFFLPLFSPAQKTDTTRLKPKILSTVEITASKPIVKQEIDRLIYDVQADLECRSSSLLEIMRKVPMLTVDGDGTVELKGGTNYKILINGKPSAMMDRNAKEVLRNMPASTIQSIEVITTPPSKYDAEGLSGIINIITNKRIPIGYLGTLNLNATTPTGGPAVGGSLSAKTGNVGLTAFTGGGMYNTPETFDYNTRTSSTSTLYQRNQKEKESRSGYFGVEINYEIDSLNVLSSSLNHSGTIEHSIGTQFSSNTGQSFEQYLLANSNDTYGNSTDASANYQLGFASNKKRLLTLSYRYYAHGYDSQGHIGFSQRLNFSLPDYRQLDLGNSAEHTVQLDYVTNLRKIDVEAGFKAIFRNNSSDFRFLEFDPKSGVFEQNPIRTNEFDNTQYVYAAYNSYQMSIGAFNVKAGFRLEQTLIHVNFNTNQHRIVKQQLNLLPAVAISRKLGRFSTVTAGFTQRIQRPGIYQLNPFVNRLNPNNETSGNPDLHPVVANGIQLGYSLQQKAFFNVSLDYTFFNSLINQVAVYDRQTNITRTTYQNTGTAKLLGANFSVNYPVNKQWNLSTNSKIFYGRILGVSLNTPIVTSGTMYSIGLNTGYKFEKGWRASASVNYKSRSFTLQRKINAQCLSSFNISKDFVVNKFSVAVAVNNPLNKYRSNQTLLTGPDFEQSSTDISYFRSYKISMNYSFGKLSQSVRKSTRSIKNDDVN